MGLYLAYPLSNWYGRRGYLTYEIGSSITAFRPGTSANGIAIEHTSQAHSWVQVRQPLSSHSASPWFRPRFHLSFA